MLIFSDKSHRLLKTLFAKNNRAFVATHKEEKKYCSPHVQPDEFIHHVPGQHYVAAEVSYDVEDKKEFVIFDREGSATIREYYKKADAEGGNFAWYFIPANSLSSLQQLGENAPEKIDTPLLAKSPEEESSVQCCRMS